MTQEPMYEFHKRLLRLEKLVDFLYNSRRPEAGCDYTSRVHELNEQARNELLDGICSLRIWLEGQE